MERDTENEGNTRARACWQQKWCISYTRQHARGNNNIIYYRFIFLVGFIINAQQHHFSFFHLLDTQCYVFTHAFFICTILYVIYQFCSRVERNRPSVFDVVPSSRFHESNLDDLRCNFSSLTTCKMTVNLWTYGRFRTNGYLSILRYVRSVIIYLSFAFNQHLVCVRLSNFRRVEENPNFEPQ